MRFLRGDGRLIAAMLAALGAGTGLGLLAPYLTGLMVNRVEQARHAGPGAFALSGGHGGIALLALAMVAAAAGAGALTFGRGYLSELIAQHSMYRARGALFEHLQSQSFDFYDTTETGQILSRATGDVETLRRLISRAGPGALAATVQFVGTAIILFRLDAALAGAVLLVAPFFAWIVVRMSQRMRPASWRLQQQLADVTTVLQEDLSSIRVVKAFCRSDHEEARFDRENQAYLDRAMDVAMLQARYQPVLGQLPTLGTVFILAYGGYQVIHHHLSLGMFVAFNSYVLMLLGPLRILGMLITMSAQAAASAERIFEILDSGGQVQQPAHPVFLPRMRGEIRFEDVHARYRTSDHWVLRGIDLTVAPGECLAIVGVVGAGKSTLVQLVPRFYDPEAGRVLVDGRDVRTLDLESLRRQVGFVLQDPFLFSDTIEENIRYGRPDASRAAVAAAARAAHIADFIESLPDGYATTVGERGLGLSGGQKQRVAIARALLTDPRILVLDDATSSVDAENEHLIWDALRRLMVGRTSLVIAHRLASVMAADRIIVLEEGRIAAQGRHEELLERSALYRTIHDLQLAPGEQAVAARGGLLA
jgi:ATP-binding cassette subfamily B protein